MIQSRFWIEQSKKTSESIEIMPAEVVAVTKAPKLGAFVGVAGCAR